MSISRQIVDAFFPDLRKHFISDPHVFPVYEKIFPLECPPTALTIALGDNASIRQPSLAIATMGGILMGLGGAWYLKKQTYWCLSFAGFGLMNVSGLLVHCIWTTPTIHYPSEAPWSWCTDCYFTGSFATALSVACLNQILPSRIWSIYNAAAHLIGFFTAAYWYSTRHEDYLYSSLGLELWYLVPLVLAVGPFCVMVMLTQPRKTCKSIWFVPFGMLVAVCGILLDAPCCHSPLAADVFQATTFAFLGCDIVFYGIFKWLLIETSSKTKMKQF